MVGLAAFLDLLLMDSPSVELVELLGSAVELVKSLAVKKKKKNKQECENLWESYVVATI
jgi:hypothetical protein